LGAKVQRRKVLAENRGPAERRIDEKIVGLAVEEFDIGCLLADFDGDRASPKALFNPKLV
jgi:hypothetical protein